MSNPSEKPSNPEPLQDEVTRLTNIIMGQIGDTDVDSALTVLCNLVGQLVASIADGKPSGIRSHVDSIAENIRVAAIAKILYDDKQSREEKAWH